MLLDLLVETVSHVTSEGVPKHGVSPKHGVLVLGSSFKVGDRGDPCEDTHIPFVVILANLNVMVLEARPLSWEMQGQRASRVPERFLHCRSVVYHSAVEAIRQALRALVELLRCFERHLPCPAKEPWLCFIMILTASCVTIAIFPNHVARL